MRYEKQGEIAAKLIMEGYHLITPIESCHHLSLKYQLPGGYSYWRTRDRELVSRSDGIIVCMMDGWSQSKGVCDEIACAYELGKEIIYLDPETLEMRDKP